ncbi:MAG: DUF3795 domain-containing protein, partial [Candidatus Cloacimonetes bacterium]|nr:DUF3795 domain-containing protein [Candidatus Cloacimonadota bacterium]
MKIMKKSYCGFDCTQCPVYRATIADDDDLRDAVVRKSEEKPEKALTRDDVNCLGCRSNTRFRGCAECEIRNCCVRHEVAS